MPLREQFSQPQGDIHACISVRVDFEDAMWAPEPSPVIRASGALSAAPRTGLACVFRIDGNYLNAVLPGYAFEGDPELGIGHTLDLSVGLAAELCFPEPIEFLDGYCCSILLCQSNHLMGHLVAPRLVKVSLVIFELSQSTFGFMVSFVGAALQFTPSHADVALLLCYIPAEIKLPQNPASADNGDGCQTRRAYIYPDYRLPSPRFFNGNFSFEVDYENPALAPSLEAEMGKGVPLREQGFESEICTVLIDWQTDALDAIEGGNAEDRVSAFGFGNLPAPRHIVVNYGFGESLSVSPVLPNSMHRFDEYLTLNWEFIPDNMVGGLV